MSWNSDALPCYSRFRNWEISAQAPSVEPEGGAAKAAVIVIAPEILATVPLCG